MLGSFITEEKQVLGEFHLLPLLEVNDSFQVWPDHTRPFLRPVAAFLSRLSGFAEVDGIRPPGRF